MIKNQCLTKHLLIGIMDIIIIIKHFNRILHKHI